MLAIKFLCEYFCCEDREVILESLCPSFNSPNYYLAVTHWECPLKHLPCIRYIHLPRNIKNNYHRAISVNLQLHFERFLERTEPTDIVIAECYKKNSDGTINWEKQVILPLDEIEVCECECNRRQIQTMVEGDDDLC
jgi:hypothetical protein